MYLLYLIRLFESLREHSPWWRIRYTYYSNTGVRKLYLSHQPPPHAHPPADCNCFATFIVLDALDLGGDITFNTQGSNIEIDLNSFGVVGPVGMTGSLNDAIEQLEHMLKGETYVYPDAP